MYRNLIPKFNYTYNLIDLVYSLFHVKNKTSTNEINIYFNTKHIYFTNYARTALTLLLKSIAKGQTLKIGIQSYTCHTIFEAISDAGCVPIFIDINDNFTLDLVSLKQNSENIDILIVTHTFGITADIKEINEVVFNKIIIEDCAHSLFSEYKGKPTGTLCDASIFSFGYGKYPSIGSGGFTIINNKNLVDDFEKLYEKLPTISIFKEYKNILKNYIFAKAFNKNLYGVFTYPIGKKLDKKFDFIGKSIQLKTKGFVSNVNIFLKNFSKYMLKNEIQNQNGNYLSKEIQNLIKVIEENEDRKINYYIFPLIHKKRDAIVSALYDDGIESGKHFSSSIIWAKEYGYISGSCPNSEKIVEEIFTIPCYYSLNNKNIDKIVLTLTKNI
jgi:perosamine synthetase